jgi:hypothetical protein
MFAESDLGYTVRRVRTVAPGKQFMFVQFHSKGNYTKLFGIIFVDLRNNINTGAQYLIRRIQDGHELPQPVPNANRYFTLFPFHLLHVSTMQSFAPYTILEMDPNVLLSQECLPELNDDSDEEVIPYYNSIAKSQRRKQSSFRKMKNIDKPNKNLKIEKSKNISLVSPLD